MSDVKIRWRWGRESERAKATAEINDEIFGVKWENFTLKWNSLTITLKSVFDWRSFSIDELCKKSHDKSIFRNWVNKKTFHWKEKNNFQVANRYLFPTPFPQSRAHSLSPPTLSITFERSRKRRRIRSKFETFHYIQQKQQLNLKAKKKIRYHSSMNRILYTFSIQLLYFICVSLLCYWVPAHLLWIME